MGLPSFHNVRENSTSKVRYTLATQLNSTRSTLLKVDCCRNWRQIGNKVDCRRIRSTLLPVLATNRQQLEFDMQLVAVDIVANSVVFVARMLNVLSTLSPVCIKQQCQTLIISARITGGDGGISPPLGFSVTPTVCVLGIPEGDRICPRHCRCT